MKTKLLIALFFLSMLNVQAQQTHYQFSHNSADYVPLGNGATVLNNLAWFDEEYVIPLAFPIYLFDDEVNNLVLLGGNLKAASKNVNNKFYSFTPHATTLVDAGFPVGYEDEDENENEDHDVDVDVDDDDIEMVTQSPLKYQVVGNAGERILKIEVNNAASLNEIVASETNLMRINYQIWFFEQHKSIEVRFGSNSITNFNLFFTDADEVNPEEPAEPVFTTGVGQYIIEDEEIEPLKIELLEGLEANPVLVNDIEFESSGLRSYPAAGRVYRFGGTLGVANFTELESKIQLYPNPTSDFLIISFNSEISQNLAYKIINTAGQSVQSGFLNKEQPIDVSALSLGAYYVKVDGFKPTKFIKK